jgi:hypothetical protein
MPCRNSNFIQPPHPSPIKYLPMPALSKRWYAGLLLIVLIPLAESCSTTKVITKYDCNTIANNPVNRRTTWTFAWGLVQPRDINPNCEPSFNHLNKVVVKTNLGFILLSAVTLGAVIPQRVEWCCAPQNIPTDTLGQRP